MKLETVGTLTSIRIADRAAVRGRIGAPSDKVQGWTKGRAIATFELADGGPIEVDLTDAEREDLLAKWNAGALVVVRVKIEIGGDA